MNYREIDLNLLMILDAMYDAGSTTLVAERLKISQPTVSFSLGKLRDVFGDELFVRVGSSVNPGDLEVEWQESQTLARTKPDLAALERGVNGWFAKNRNP